MHMPGLRTPSPLQFGAVIFHMAPQQKTWMNPQGENIEIYTKVTDAQSLPELLEALPEDEKPIFERLKKQVYHSRGKGPIYSNVGPLEQKGVYLVPPNGDTLVLLDLEDGIANIAPTTQEYQRKKVIAQVARKNQALWLHGLTKQLEPEFKGQAAKLAQSVFHILSGGNHAVVEIEPPGQVNDDFLAAVSTQKPGSFSKRIKGGSAFDVSFKLPI